MTQIETLEPLADVFPIKELICQQEQPNHTGVLVSQQRKL